jgi:hypothetical protein
MPFFFGGGGSAASNMVGATSSAAGTAGLVPAPAAGDEDKQLLGSGSFIQTSPWRLSGYTSSLYTYHSINSFGGLNRTNTTLAADKLFFSPLFVNFSFTFDRILYANRTSAQSNFKFGLYTHDRSAGVPKTLLVESANVASLAGSSNIEITVSSTTLQPDLYWLCFVSASDVPMTFRIADDSSIRNTALFHGGANSPDLANWNASTVAGLNLDSLEYAFAYSGTESLPTTLTASTFAFSGIRPAWMAIRKS